MGYFITGVLSFIGGLVFAAIYYNKAIQLGTELLKRAEGDVQRAWQHIADLPAKYIRKGL